MKTFGFILIGCVAGWLANNIYSGYLYGKVQAETGGDLTTICEQLLDNK